MAAFESNGQVILSDDSGTDGTFSVFDLSYGAGTEDTVSQSWAYLSDTGNPGNGFVVNWDFENDIAFTPANDYGDTAVLYRHSTPWNPSSQGEITALTYSIDYRTSDPAFQTMLFFVENSTIGKFSFDSAPITTDGVWHTITLANVTAAGFQPLDNQIDFAGNTPLRFGFGIFGTNPDGYGSGIPNNNTITLDNFQVVIVPEPTTIALVLVGGLVGLGLRRRLSRV